MDATITLYLSGDSINFFPYDSVGPTDSAGFSVDLSGYDQLQTVYYKFTASDINGCSDLVSATGQFTVPIVPITTTTTTSTTPTCRPNRVRIGGYTESLFSSCSFCEVSAVDATPWAGTFIHNLGLEDIGLAYTSSNVGTDPETSVPNQSDQTLFSINGKAFYFATLTYSSGVWYLTVTCFTSPSTAVPLFIGENANGNSCSPVGSYTRSTGLTGCASGSASTITIEAY